jgi:hypothetical protein
MVTGSGGLLHVPTEDGLNIRIIALIAAAWTLIFSLPVLFVVPEIPPNARTPRVGFFRSYAVLVRDIGKLELEFWNWKNLEWQDSWDTTQSDGQKGWLPTRVKITITVKTPEGTDIKLTTQARIVMQEPLIANP